MKPSYRSICDIAMGWQSTVFLTANTLIRIRVNIPSAAMEGNLVFLVETLLWRNDDGWVREDYEEDALAAPVLSSAQSRT